MSNISIIIGFKNREIERVTYALESLANQSYKSFELIFVDYGSDEQVADQVKQLVESYPFAKYYYSETRGWFWNRAHALNIGIKQAKGSIIIISDIDLVLESVFLQKVSVLNFDKFFYTFSCYYLPEGFDLLKKDLEKDGVHYEQNYVGLCALNRESLFSIQGFDEFYMVWGAEDDDLYRRLTFKGLERKQVQASSFKVFHQWHSIHSPEKPSLWYLTMVNYLYTPKQQVQKDWGKIIISNDRQILGLIVNSVYKEYEELNFSENQLLFYNPFIDKFHKMLAGEIAWLEFELTVPVVKSFKIINKLFNRKFNETNSNYTSLKDVKDFLHYFIGGNKHLIKDYYVKMSEHSLSLIVQKN